ncbi:MULTISPECIES: hypothetical protein [Proteiniphilum]|nr:MULTISPECIES: hypothetical protein [Proteiniphilum]ULB35765.1 hypothetical protein KDN43_07010 [Proteiniphilum propionicum]
MRFFQSYSRSSPDHQQIMDGSWMGRGWVITGSSQSFFRTTIGSSFEIK